MMGARPIRFLGELVRPMVDSVRVSSPIFDSRQSFPWQQFIQYVIGSVPYTAVDLDEYVEDIARRMANLFPSGHPVRNHAWVAAEFVDCAKYIVEAMSVIFRRQPPPSRFSTLVQC